MRTIERAHCVDVTTHSLEVVMRKHDPLARRSDPEVVAPLDIDEINPRFDCARDRRVIHPHSAMRENDRLRRRGAQRGIKRLFVNRNDQFHRNRNSALAGEAHVCD